jgi:hypothetical protein
MICIDARCLRDLVSNSPVFCFSLSVRAIVDVMRNSTQGEQKSATSLVICNPIGSQLLLSSRTV